MSKTTFYVYDILKDNVMLGSFEIEDNATGEEILNHFNAAHVLYGTNIIFRQRKR